MLQLKKKDLPNPDGGMISPIGLMVSAVEKLIPSALFDWISPVGNCD
jgi:hypothetical protein